MGMKKFLQKKNILNFYLTIYQYSSQTKNKSNFYLLRRVSVSPFHRACPPSASPSGEAGGSPCSA